jgi:Zn-dependent protease
MKLFRFRGITVEMHPTFYLLPLYVGVASWIDGGARSAVLNLLILALVYTCVVLHEFGHALTAIKLGVPVRYIVLLPIGGMALLSRMPRNPLAELLIVAAGPAVNFVIAGVSLLLLGGHVGDLSNFDLSVYTWPDTLRTLFVVNLSLGCFNLLPAFPMDGGRLLRALLALGGDYMKATRRAVIVGRVVAVIGIVYAVFTGQFVLIFLFTFILLMGGWEYKQLQREQIPPIL